MPRPRRGEGKSFLRSAKFSAATPTVARPATRYASTSFCFAGTARTSLTMASVSVASASNAPTRRQQRQDADAIAKDETELRLEKALFGDTAGFLDSLSAVRYGEGKALRLYNSESDDNAGSNDEDLGDVPDEDVSLSSSMPPLF